jgi:hypothetical protein
MFRGRSNALSFLDLRPNASDEEIKKAYRKMARNMHPNKGGRTENFQSLQEAMNILSKMPRYNAPPPRPTPRYNAPPPRPTPRYTPPPFMTNLNANNVAALAVQMKDGFKKTQKIANGVFSSLPGMGRKTRDGWIKPMKDTYPYFLQTYSKNTTNYTFADIDWKPAAEIEIKRLKVSIGGCILKNASSVLHNPMMFAVSSNLGINIRTLLPSQPGYPGFKVSFGQSNDSEFTREATPAYLKDLEALLLAVRTAYADLDSIFRRAPKLAFFASRNLPREVKEVIGVVNSS